MSPTLFKSIAVTCAVAFVSSCATAPEAAIHVNQHAYLPDFSKQATFVPKNSSPTQQPRAWALVSDGKTVANGETRYQGFDSGAQEHTHLIDFSDVTSAGTYQLIISDNDKKVTSFKFDIRSDALEDLKYESLAYFYHNRSGQPILKRYVKEPQHAREAGHLDTEVRTAACFEDPENADCRIFNATGGWYDAGDHGKYVVNGGISVWTLLNMYERAKYLGHNLHDFADGSLSIPENDNGVPDLLDEVRFELEWMLRMQVPAGYNQAGMVHHKLHSVEWSELPMRPDQDRLARIAQPVSTSATLNFAAVMAHCARVYDAFDPAFASECLAAAQGAYTAAKAAPEVYPTLNTPGAGDYGDKTLGDEFYWAATELYLTTGHKTYWQAMLDSPYHLSFHSDTTTGASASSESNIPNSIIAWPLTNMLGTLSSATVGDKRGADKAFVEAARAMIVEAADHFVQVAKDQGYGQPYPGEAVVWGSNSDIVNNMLVLGIANDVTCGGDKAYLNTMHNGLSYLFGRNPLGQSYVTRYGDKPLLAPHHRFWANSLDDDYPTPPAGALSGGPNKAIQDPVAQKKIMGCAPLKCFIDDIQSWSTNEITVNWNAPFAWVVAYMDEQAKLTQKPKACPAG